MCEGQTLETVLDARTDLGNICRASSPVARSVAGLHSQYTNSIRGVCSKWE